MFYAAKCYWPGVTEQELERAMSRIASHAAWPRKGRREVVSLGGMLFPDDALTICLFDARSGATVMTEAIAAGMPCDRVMELIWLAPRSDHSTAYLKAGKEKR
jgi:hypothetical protein